MSKLLTDKQVAELLCCSRASIWRWCSSNSRDRLPSPITIGERTKRWRLADIERYLAEREAQSA